MPSNRMQAGRQTGLLKNLVSRQRGPCMADMGIHLCDVSWWAVSLFYQRSTLPLPF